MIRGCLFFVYVDSSIFQTGLILSLLSYTCILQALVNEDPNYVVKRYESRKYAIDESVTSEYLKVGCLGLMSKEMENIFIFPAHVQYIHVLISFHIYISFMLCPQLAAMPNIPQTL